MHTFPSLIGCLMLRRGGAATPLHGHGDCSGGGANDVYKGSAPPCPHAGPALVFPVLYHYHHHHHHDEIYRKCKNGSSRGEACVLWSCS